MSRVLFLLVVAVALACANGRQQGGSGIVTTSGRIGLLQLDHSTRKSVVASADRPDVETLGKAGSGGRYDALGYDCDSRPGRDRLPLRGESSRGGPYCRTAYYIDRKTGLLETFFTTASRFSQSDGVRVGMAAATAERLLHKRRRVGCATDIYLYAANATMAVAFVGGKVQPSHYVVGGRVFGFVPHSKRRDAGIFDCL